jgi:RHS repeat-associated protein
MTDGTGTTKYAYDQLDRLTESENGHKETVKYEYDLANEQTKITYPNGKAVTRAYDKASRLEKVTDWLTHVTKFSYNADSENNATTFPAESKDEDKYMYNDAGQLAEVKMVNGTETLASVAYGRDNDGQVKKIISKGLPGPEITENTYDENNRLTKYGSTEYKYDPADNPTKEGSNENKYNEADELEKSGTTGFSYDELGERTKTTPEKGPATTYGYDQAGNLTSVERPEGEGKPKIEDTYAYDGNGLRVSQTIAGKTSYLAWDLAESTPLILSDGTNSYIYGPGGLPFEQINTEGNPLYLHHDQQGSTRMLTNAAGKSEATFTYDAYGNTTGTTGTATTPLGYASQYTSADTGLIYLRARTYDPTTAQFLTVDPLNSQTRQPYAYTSDNPLNISDPTGMCGLGSLGEAAESVNPFSSENCAYQGTKALVDWAGANASEISTAAALAAGAFRIAAAFIPPTAPVTAPLAVALTAVSSAAGAYASGEEAAQGETLNAALDALGSVLGGTAAAERFLSKLESEMPGLAGADQATKTRALADILDKLGYTTLAASLLSSQEASHRETPTSVAPEISPGQEAALQAVGGCAFI